MVLVEVPLRFDVFADVEEGVLVVEFSIRWGLLLGVGLGGVDEVVEVIFHLIISFPLVLLPSLLLPLHLLHRHLQRLK